ncbi:class I SAM-dependent methyltransferase [Methylovirgula sp. 4M-Z18]|uniref:class I SAM-dependent methyltransferase n=1 Tax=Methylovirgula sp. 4M-Z18 TaxID=2293567 RepID=UPI000E2E51A6|nr:methyltransferase domain-containing protein [Methylovirgula sp. 4M-Z18]RFB80688.1 class I SAM-dependent methyltransferase [Methylovirgula sp. 4M-Z18]
MSWREFWNGEHSIYVNARHKALHYDRIAKDMAALVPPGGARVLDYGCGEALGAAIVAAKAARLYLYDSAPNVQGKLRGQFAATANVTILSDSDLAALPAQSLDIVIANSLLQYLRRDEFGQLLDYWHNALGQGGQLILADVIPPDASAILDVQALLGFAWQGGFFAAACKGLVATFFSDYRKKRGEIGLTRYGISDMQQLLRAHGFEPRRAARNIGHNQDRLCFIAVKT